MLWEAIIYGSNMTVARYVEDVLQPTLLFYLDDDPLAYFQQGTELHHITRWTKNFLGEAGINVMPWSPR